MSNEINFLDVNSNEVKEVSTNFVWPKGTYALKLEEVKQVDNETSSRIVFFFVIEDAADVSSSMDISKIIGKKMVYSLPIFNQTPEDIAESLGKVKYAILNSGANKETQGTLMDLINSAIGQVTWHKVFEQNGKDGVTRNQIDWTEFKPKA